LALWAMFFRDATAPVRSFGIGTWLILKIGDHYPAVELGYRHLPELGEGGPEGIINKQVFEKSDLLVAPIRRGFAFYAKPARRRAFVTEKTPKRKRELVFIRMVIPAWADHSSSP